MGAGPGRGAGGRGGRSLIATLHGRTLPILPPHTIKLVHTQSIHASLQMCRAELKKRRPLLPCLADTGKLVPEARVICRVDLAQPAHCVHRKRVVARHQIELGAGHTLDRMCVAPAPSGASTASGPSRDAPSDASRAGASRPPPDRVSGIRADLSRWGRTRPLVDQEYIRVLPVR